MQFLQASWLWAMSAVSIPILIHLLNKRPPKVIQVGSVRFWAAGAQPQVYRVRLEQWFLLLLRCLLIILVALLLAEPVWQSSPTPQKHLLISPSFWQLPASPEKEALQYKIAQWQQAGYQVKSLLPEFPEADSSASASQHRNYWALAASFAQKAAQDSVILLSDAQARHFWDEAPALPAHWQWHYFADEQVHYSLDEVYFYKADSLGLWLSESSEEGHKRHFLLGAAPPVGASITFQRPNIRIWRKNTQTFHLDKAIQDSILVTENHIETAILQEAASPHDTVFLSKLLRSVATFHKKKLKITYINPQDTATKTKVLFYLSSQKPSQALCSRFAMIVCSDTAQLSPFEESLCGQARLYSFKNYLDESQEEVLNIRFLNLMSELLATPPSRLPSLHRLSQSQRAYPIQNEEIVQSFRPYKELKTIFWYFVVFVLIVERIISYLYGRY